jgi:tetratricopeptide (TPR) repeat protein
MMAQFPTTGSFAASKMPSPAKRSSTSRAGREKARSPEAPPLPLGDAQVLIRRCHAIAEELNKRGALDLAVPFYRQTIALLLADAASSPRAEPACLAQLDAASLTTFPVQTAEHLPPELDQHLLALEQDLSKANALTVRKLLLDIEEQVGQTHPGLIALLAKTYVLEGDFEQSRLRYEQALALAPADPKLIVNTAAAYMACGDCQSALNLLRPLARQRQHITDSSIVRSLLSNLAIAEMEAGSVDAAASLRVELAGLDPDALPLQDWLDDARRWSEMGHRQETKKLLIALRAVYPSDRGVLEFLGLLLEELGDFREAALIYRDLLRPSLTE